MSRKKAKIISLFSKGNGMESSMDVLPRMAVYFLQEKILLTGMLSAVLVGTLCGIYAPSLQSNAIDRIAGASCESLGSVLVLMLTAHLLHCISQLVQSLISAKMSQRIIKKMREELFGKILDLPISYLDTHSHGDVMSRMTNDIENISTTVSQVLPALFSGVLTIIGTVLIMLWYCWQLTILSCVTVILTLVATKHFSGKMRKLSRQSQTLLGSLHGTVEEMVAGYKTVVAYDRQDTTVKDFAHISDALKNAGIKTNILAGVMGPVLNCIENIGFVIIAVFGGYFSVKGLISVGVISAFVVYAKQFSRPINEIAQIYGQLQTAIASAERVFSVLDELNEDKAGDNLADSVEPNIHFDQVCFSYTPENPVIQDFTLTIPSRKKVALVGATGSGKTTIVNLLLRFYDVNSGDVFIGNQSLHTISRDSLRKNVAIVLQDTVLFSDTVCNNLQYACDETTQERLQEAVSLSCSEELIQSLPYGFETILTGAGKSISQGQRQLLAIARAFLADPKILILDEATSNVDTRTEKAIQDAMHKVMQNRTSIVIAHRLSTIRDADIIVVMDQGRIVETGNHQSLLRKKGKYYELYRTQFAGMAT